MEDVGVPDVPDVSMPSGGWEPPAFNWDFMRNWSPPSGPSSGSDFDWNALANTIGKWGGLGKFALDTGFGIRNQMAAAKYQKDMQAYWKNRQQIESDYNAKFSDYLDKRAAWEEQFMGSFGEFQGQFGEAMANAESIINQSLAAAGPLFEQSQELLVPAIAALARGEVPEQWAPVLNQAKQRATAAAVQQMVSAGMDPDQARSIVQQQVDQMGTQMLLQMATAASGQGLAIGEQGFKGLGVAGGMLGPIFSEYAAMQQVLASMFGGGFPSLPGGGAGPPPPPSA